LWFDKECVFILTFDGDGYVLFVYCWHVWE